MASLVSNDLQWFLDAMPDAVLIVGPDGQIRRANAKVETVFGYQPQELIGQPLEMLLPERLRAPHSVHRTVYRATAKTRGMGTGLEWRALRKDGTESPVGVSLSPASHDENGRLVIAVVRDMSASMELLRLTRQNEEKYRMVVETASEVFYRVSFADDPLRGRVDFVSARCEEVTGHAPHAFLANPGLWIESVHPEDRASLFESTRAILSSRMAGTRYYRIRNEIRDEYRWIEDRVVPLLDCNGNVTGCQGAARDITERVCGEQERQRLERELHQLQKMEAIGRVAGEVAHDFNNLLTVILGASGLALAQADPASPIYTELQQIDSAARRAADLTRQLLAFGRRQIFRPRVFDLNRHLEDLAPTLRRAIPDNVSMTFKLGADLWAVHLDPSQIDQVVMNLSLNARDAMPDGGVLSVETANETIDERYCSTHAGFVPGDYVTLSVIDTGCGMDETTRRHAFEPFFTTKPSGGGTGLGLAIVYGIVRQSHGFISLSSEPKHGTAVRVYFPRYQDEGPATGVRS